MARIPKQWTVERSSYLRWIERRERSRRGQQVPATGPLISIVMPVYNTPLRWLREAVGSVVSQDYPHWQLCIADDGSTEPWVAPELERWVSSDSRISVRSMQQNVGIARASNAALELVDGQFVALMDHDDVIPSHALGAVATALSACPDARLVYTDSDHLNERGERCTPFFKPDWDYVRFLGQNFLNHLTVIRADVLEHVNGWNEGYEGSQDYDLYLRVLEVIDAEQIHHIPEILYHWRDAPDSKARADLGAAVRAARRAITHHLDRVGAVAEVKGAPSSPIFNRIRWRSTDPAGGVLVLLYGNDEQQLVAAKQRVEATQPGLGVSIRTHDSSSADATLGTFVNQSVRASSCEMVLILNADLVAETDEWLEGLVAIGQVGGTGVVGAACSTEDGYLYAFPRFRENLPRLAIGPENAYEVGARHTSSGYIANLSLDQCVDFVSPEVMVFSKGLFNDIGGFGEGLDDGLAAETFCTAAVALGYRNVWSPHVRFRLDRRQLDRRRGSSSAGHAGEGVVARLPEIFLNALSDQELLEWDVAWEDAPDGDGPVRRP